MASAITRDSAHRFWETLQTGGAPTLRPEGAPWCFSSGPNPYRVLLVGGRAAVGYGLAGHDEALAGQIARILTRSTECGVEVDIVADDDMSVEAGVQELERRNLQRYNAVLLVFDALEACHPEAHAARHLRPLLQRTGPHLDGSTPLVVAFAPPLPTALTGIAARPPHPRRLEELHLELSRASLGSPRSVPVVLPLATEAEPAALYEQWARPIVRATVPRLPRWDEPHSRRERIDVEARQRAVERLRLGEPIMQKEFQGIVEYARLAYGARNASLTVFEHGDVRFAARRGFDWGSIPEGASVSAVAATALAGLSVGDARADAELSDRETVRAGLVRFYAGYRLESPDGHPVAVLSVFDPQPRDPAAADLGMLRNYALAAQRRLWALAARRSLAR